MEKAILLILPSVSRVMLAKAKGARVLLDLYDQIGCLAVQRERDHGSYDSPRPVHRCPVIGLR